MMRAKSPPSPLMVLAALLVIPVTPLGADDGSRLEDRVRAAFLFNFTHFVIWQDPARRQAGTIVVGVEEDSGVARVLRQMIEGEVVGGATVEVVSLDSTRIDECHVAYLSGARDRESLVRWLGPAPRAGVLTVGDAPEFLELGGIIRFHRAGSRIRFQLSLENARRAGIKLSSKLIQVAQTQEAAGP